MRPNAYAAELAVFLGDIPGDLKAARALSWDCPECHGEGITERWYDDTFRAGEVGLHKLDKNGSVIPRSFPCYCHRCPAGRFVEHMHATDAPDVRARFMDLASNELISLRANWYRYRPDQRDAIDAAERNSKAFAPLNLVRMLKSARDQPKGDAWEPSVEQPH